MRVFALLMCLMLLFTMPSGGEADNCFSRENAPYWHRDPDCAFGETGFLETAVLGRETRTIEASRAESEGQKPCPGCAAAFAPAFTGDFPDWPHAIAPWGYEKGEMIEAGGWPRGAAELPEEVLRSWGAPDDALYRLYPNAGNFEEGGESSCPDDYAGLFVNACGGCTVLLVDPSAGSVARWREALQGEFWVLSARYGYNELDPLAKTVSDRIMGTDIERAVRGEPSFYHITSVSVNCIANSVEIGVSPDAFHEGVARIREALASFGYADPCMLRFVPEAYSTWT